MGVGPIPWDKIVYYAQYHQLAPDVEKAFVLVLMEMDAGYLEYNAAQEKKKGDRKTGK